MKREYILLRTIDLNVEIGMQALRRDAPFILVALVIHCFADYAVAERKNVLFIAVDDLRPELACYGKSHIHSPNIDALASSAVLFEHAYCMVPTCGASRASLMTGIRPTRNRFKNYLTWADKDASGVVTLNTHFRQNDFTTVSLGKIFHHAADSLGGWSQQPWRPRTSDWHKQAAMRADIRKHRARFPDREKVRGRAWEWSDDPDESYRDGEVATQAIRQLAELDESEPFFLAVGFYKPHLPFCAPKKYWDLYDPDEIELPDNRYPPRNAPQGAVHTSGELRSYAGISPKGPVSDETARSLIHGYYACVSFTDAQIGRILRELDRRQLAANTVVVLWGDHGWQLGEHGMWNKHSCFETSMHAPLLIRAPGAHKPGTRVAKPVEFIDIYPTLCELANLHLPRHLQGQSLLPLMENPQADWKQFAVGRFKNGDTIRSSTHRYSEYRGPGGRVTGSMLYDHGSDPDENTNVATNSANASVVDELSNGLRAVMESSN